MALSGVIVASVVVSTLASGFAMLPVTILAFAGGGGVIEWACKRCGGTSLRQPGDQKRHRGAQQDQCCGKPLHIDAARLFVSSKTRDFDVPTEK